MKPEKQRIAIAEACGWTKCDTSGSECWISPSGIHSTSGNVVFPSYLTSLDAMHEAEKVLDEKQIVWYLQKLSQVRLKQGEGGMIACMIDRLAFATAPQRAEAFLRTIGKWEES